MARENCTVSVECGEGVKQVYIIARRKGIEGNRMREMADVGKERGERNSSSRQSCRGRQKINKKMKRERERNAIQLNPISTDSSYRIQSLMLLKFW